MSNGRLTFAGMATSIHVRGDGIGSTTLRKKADPARTNWVDGMPSVKQGEKVTVLRFDGPFSLVRAAVRRGLCGASISARHDVYDIQCLSFL